MLRVTDDEITLMQKEIDIEKEDGLGLPVSVTNDIASQQMAAQVQTDQMVQQSELMPDPAAGGASGGGSSGGGSSKSSPAKSKSKSSSGSKSVKGDLSLEEVETTFTRLKRIL